MTCFDRLYKGKFLYTKNSYEPMHSSECEYCRKLNKCRTKYIHYMQGD